MDELRTVYIMWLREMKRQFRSKSRMLGSLGQPLLFFLSFGYGLGSVFKAAGQGNYIEFLAPGVIGMSILFTSVFNGIQIIWDRQFGFLKETLVAPVSRTSIMIGRTLGGATIGTMQGCIVLLITLLTGFHLASWTVVIPTILVMLLTASVFAALGITIASLMRDMQGFQIISNFLIMPLFLISGAMFPLQNAPSALMLLARLDPLAYGIDAMRSLLTHSGHFSLFTDISVLLVFTTVLLTLGSYFFRRIEV